MPVKLLIHSAIFLLITVSLTVSCQDNTSLTTDDTPRPPIATTVTTPQPTTVPTTVPPVTATELPIVLTLWTVEAVSPQAEGAAGRFIGGMLNAFARNFDDIELAEPILKQVNGKGSMLNFLRTGKEVAPSILPDVAIMDAADLERAETDDLLIPLDGRLDRTIVQDLLPAARIVGTVDGRLMGVPISLDMQHTVYNQEIFATPPTLWSDIITNTEARYAFPIRDDDGLVDTATLSQYLAAGGRLEGDQGYVQIDESVFQEVLEFYRICVDNGIINPDRLQSSTPNSIIERYLNEELNIIHLNVSDYLANRDAFEAFSGFTHLPTRNPDNTPVAMLDGWVLVLVTEDPERQAAAISLIEWFLGTPNNTTWNSVSQSVPTRDASFQRIAGESPYWQFLATQLNNTQPQPRFAGYDSVGRILRQALLRVLNGEISPDEAASITVDAISQ